MLRIVGYDLMIMVYGDDDDYDYDYVYRSEFERFLISCLYMDHARTGTRAHVFQMWGIVSE